MRKGKNGILRVMDTPHCSECKEPLLISDEFFASMPADQVSGCSCDHTCENCGSIQNVCPIIQWWTFQEDDA
jgi:hypothetical protein